MTTSGLRFIRKDQRGFTLVEMLVAIALVGLISLGIAAAIMQVLTINADASNHMIAVRQVQQAGKEVSKDTLQAQNVTCGGSNGFPLTLAWEHWDSMDNVVVYTLQDMPSSPDLKMLERSHTIAGDSPTVRVIARYIDADQTNCDPLGVLPGDGVLTFTVTAAVGNGPQGASETRVYEVEPRPTSTS